MEGLMGDTTKIRKRGCSPTSSTTSSVIQNHRYKRAILVGRKERGVGVGVGVRGGSSTPVPTWRMVGSRSPSVIIRAAAVASPRYPPSLSGRSKARQQPVSARKLAAAIWELNEVPSPSPRAVVAEEEGLRERRVGRREKVRRSVNWGSGSCSGSLPPHLSDPSHSPVSERIECSGTGGHRRKESSIYRRMKNDSFDSVSNASFMEVETRSRCQTPSGSAIGVKTRLKDVSNTLTTSKELLKIISRMWGHEGEPSSSTSLISALHAELERARLQINQLIQEDHSSDSKEINYLLKRYAEEKATWENKVEAAVKSIAGELEVERKLRRRLESLNKKLGKELAGAKVSLQEAAKELEDERMAREAVEQEREMLHVAEALREERTHMKLSDAKHHFEEKSSKVDKMRNELEALLRTNGSRDNNRQNGFVCGRRDGDLSFCRREAKENEEGEVEYGSNDGGNSTESDLHSIELNVENPNQNKMPSYSSFIPMNFRRSSIDEDHKGRKSLANQVVARRSASLLRSVSDVVEWGDSPNYYEVDKQRRSCGDDIQRHRSTKKDPRHHLMPSSRLGLEREFVSLSSHQGPPWPLRDPCDDVALQRPMTMEGRENSRRTRR